MEYGKILKLIKMKIIKEYNRFSINNDIFDARKLIDITQYIVQELPFKL